MIKKLSDKLKNALEYSDIEIPLYITQNLSKELREYQVSALKHYLLQRNKPQTNHLMFNMATGSGKTLIMAALMLEAYKNGYRNFIFFVNSSAILEKTRANFCDLSSPKYLFAKEIIIDDKRVQINAIENLDESKEGCINIHFSTIQALFSLFTKAKENAITLEDLQDKKLVFLADEAHHLNSDTKKEGKSKEKKALSEGWERIIQKAFESNKQNLMLEFSATIPREKEVQEKYKDKIIYEYALEEFCQNGYSKRIFLIKYENDDLKQRFLGAMLLSLYRELLAQKYELSLKPVILFKSEGIEVSKNNQKIFMDFIEHLQSFDIEKFYKNIIRENELFTMSLAFFKNEFKEHYAVSVTNFLKNNFKSFYTLNTNDEKELEKNQILLNTLEDKNNHIRVIFAVDKLNEGWDVLNLFDIVRLSSKKISKKSSEAITTKEAQLIGRGARYCPFKSPKLEFDSELLYKRKYDNDLNNELSILERLSYHTRNDVEFIKSLNESMNEQGLLIEDDKKRVSLKVNERFKDIVSNGRVYYANNKRFKRCDLAHFSITKQEIEQKIKELEIPLFSNAIKESEEKFQKMQVEEEYKKLQKLHIIESRYFFKATNVLGLDFKELNKNFDFASKKDFIENFLQNIPLIFAKKQEFNTQNKLEIAKYILQNFKAHREKIKQEPEVSEFMVHRLNIQEKIIFKSEEKIKDVKFDWLYHNPLCLDSKLEREFVEFIDARKEEINKKFSWWFVMRNEGFEEFKIYNDDKKDEANYAKGFEPDFIFFGKRHKDESILGIQCFMEVKGGHLVQQDKWKETFLESLKEKCFDKILNSKELAMASGNLKLEHLPFFTDRNSFDKAFREFLSR